MQPIAITFSSPCVVDFLVISPITTQSLQTLTCEVDAINLYIQSALKATSEQKRETF
jgi:hypothetical protein